VVKSSLSTLSTWVDDKNMQLKWTKPALFIGGEFESRSRQRIIPLYFVVWE
jgi:hypothetical protein